MNTLTYDLQFTLRERTIVKEKKYIDASYGPIQG